MLPGVDVGTDGNGAFRGVVGKARLSAAAAAAASPGEPSATLGVCHNIYSKEAQRQACDPIQ